MVKGKIKVIQFRRKRLGKTNYRKRLRLLMSGKDRLVVRFSAKYVTAQIISYNQSGDLVKVGVKSSSLTKQGWNYGAKNIPAAYLTGLLLAKKAKEKNYAQELILDTGFITLQKQGRLFAVLKGAIDGGLAVKIGDKKILPNQETFSGLRIVNFANDLLKDSKEKYNKQFSKYVSCGVDPLKMPEVFSKIKSELIS